MTIDRRPGRSRSIAAIAARARATSSWTTVVSSAVMVLAMNVRAHLTPAADVSARCYGSTTVTTLDSAKVGATVPAGRITARPEVHVANSVPRRCQVKTWRTLLNACLIWLLAAGMAWAQAVAGSQVSGVVKDSSGGVLPGVEVTITKTDTGAVRTVVTGADGGYVFPNLPVGPYQLKVVLQGFNTYVQDGIVLQVSTNPHINVTLSVGSVSEQITVTANSDDGRDAIDRRRPGHRQPARHRAAAQRPAGDGADLPLRPCDLRAGGRPQHQQELSDRDHLGGRRPGQRHDLHHGRRHAQRSVQQPEPADAVSRRAAGVQGRDQLAAGALRPSRGVGGQHRHQVRHQRFTGNAFEFVRNYRFNARNSFAPARDSLKRNQFGGTIGGPIIKNKLFFFGGYQGRDREEQPADERSASCRRRRCWPATSPRSRRRRAAAGRSRCRRPAASSTTRSIRRASARSR